MVIHGIYHQFGVDIKNHKATLFIVGSGYTFILISCISHGQHVWVHMYVSVDIYEYKYTTSLNSYNFIQ